MTTTFENAVIGDEVFSLRYGWCEVIAISEEEKILTVYTPAGFGDIFTFEGKEHQNDVAQILFWDEPEYDIPCQPQRCMTINGIQIPCDSFSPKYNQYYVYPCPSHPNYYGLTSNQDMSEDKYRKINNLCYPNTDKGIEAAIKHAQAFLASDKKIDTL